MTDHEARDQLVADGTLETPQTLEALERGLAGSLRSEVIHGVEGRARAGNHRGDAGRSWRESRASLDARTLGRDGEVR